MACLVIYTLISIVKYCRPVMKTFRKKSCHFDFVNSLSICGHEEKICHFRY